MPKYTGDDSWRKRWPDVDAAFPAKPDDADHRCDTLVGEFGDVVVFDRQGFTTDREWLVDTHSWLAFTRDGVDITAQLHNALEARVNAEFDADAIEAAALKIEHETRSLADRLVLAVADSFDDTDAARKRSTEDVLVAQLDERCVEKYSERRAQCKAWFADAQSEWLRAWERDIELLRAGEKDGLRAADLELEVISAKGYPMYESRAREEASKHALNTVRERARVEWPLLRASRDVSLLTSHPARLYKDALSWYESELEKLDYSTVEYERVDRSALDEIRRASEALVDEVVDALQEFRAGANARLEFMHDAAAEVERLATGMLDQLDLQEFAHENHAKSYAHDFEQLVPKGICYSPANRVCYLTRDRVIDWHGGSHSDLSVNWIRIYGEQFSRSQG